MTAKIPSPGASDPKKGAKQKLAVTGPGEVQIEHREGGLRIGPVFHGTDAEFKEIEVGHERAAVHTYFAPSMDQGERWGGRVLRCWLEVKSLFDMSKAVGAGSEQDRVLRTAYESIGGNYDLDGYPDFLKVVEQGAMYSRFGHSGFQDDVLQHIFDAGYDCVLMQDAGWNGFPGQSFVVYDPGCARYEGPGGGSHAGTAPSNEGSGAAMNALAGIETVNRYVTFPDFHKKPLEFVERENWPFEGDLLLRNGFFIHQEEHGNGHVKKGSWTLLEPGGDPSGCAMRHGNFKKKTDAILAALDLKPFEPLAEKRARVEAAARRGSDPELLVVVDGLLDECKSMLGALKDDSRQAIRSYMALPSIEGWEEIMGTILAGMARNSTLWQLWTDVNPSAPRSGPPFDDDDLHSDEWDMIPTPMEVLVILRTAISVRKDAEAERRTREKEAKVQAAMDGFLQAHAPVTFGRMYGEKLKVTVDVQEDPRICLGCFKSEAEARAFCVEHGLPIVEN